MSNDRYNNEDELELWRRALETTHGRDYWQSVRDLVDPQLPSPAEVPAGAETPPAHLSRRQLIKLMGASIGLAGLGGCLKRPEGEIIPYVAQPPELTPGVSLEYATSMVIDGFAVGLLARSNDGRPTKLEGNPEHPMSLGATDVFHQASILDLYSPGRARFITEGGRGSSWTKLAARFDRLGREARVWVVMTPQSSPLVEALTARVARRFPRARFVYHSPLDRTELYRGARTIFGRPVEPQYQFDKATRILSLGGDFLSSMPGSLRWARTYASRRRLASPRDPMSRHYQAETAPSPTGTIADHRLAVRPSEIVSVGAGIVAKLVDFGTEAPLSRQLRAAWITRGRPHRRWVQAVASDLANHRGESLVVAGDQEPAEVHVIAALLNHALGAPGRTLHYTDPILLDADGTPGIDDLIAALEAGEVDLACVLEANPVYTSAAGPKLARLLRAAPETVHLTLFDNETSAACNWVLPAKHYLESWGDARAYDGTISFTQPLIAPLYRGRSSMELLAMLAGRPDLNDHLLLRDLWRERLGPTRFATEWKQHIQRGFLEGSASPPVEVTPRESRSAGALVSRAVHAWSPGLELLLVQSPKVYDGRFAHNGWLQELPHPITKLTWDNAALISPRTALEAGVQSEDRVRLSVGDSHLEAPVLIVPGHADGTVTLALGYGRRDTEPLATAVGVDAYRLMRPGGRHRSTGAELMPAGARHRLALTQDHFRTGGRHIALHADLQDYRRHPEFTRQHRERLPSLLPSWDYSSGPQWAMTIDTMICTGCSSCVVACQAENNIPIVGKSGVHAGREMHWIRIDRHHHGAVANPHVVNQPMLCQHCEKAPCEYVCPVFATSHSPDGLNEMTYNRCIGTRFCSNNCPYKVRRFNWFEYNEDHTTADLQRNPSVTVRARGVMEKCTYCVQRIRAAEIDARKEKRSIRPGEVQTACAQACPTGAIQFGSLEHSDTAMVEWRGQPRAYNVLHELGTLPRTRYLAVIRNPNPELEPGG